MPAAHRLAVGIKIEREQHLVAILQPQHGLRIEIAFGHDGRRFAPGQTIIRRPADGRSPICDDSVEIRGEVSAQLAAREPRHRGKPQITLAPGHQPRFRERDFETFER